MNCIITKTDKAGVSADVIKQNSQDKLVRHIDMGQVYEPYRTDPIDIHINFSPDDALDLLEEALRRHWTYSDNKAMHHLAKQARARIRETLAELKELDKL